MTYQSKIKELIVGILYLCTMEEIPIFKIDSLGLKY